MSRSTAYSLSTNDGSNDQQSLPPAMSTNISFSSYLDHLELDEQGEGDDLEQFQQEQRAAIQISNPQPPINLSDQSIHQTYPSIDSSTYSEGLNNSQNVSTNPNIPTSEAGELSSTPLFSLNLFNPTNWFSSNTDSQLVGEDKTDKNAQNREKKKQVKNTMYDDSESSENPDEFITAHNRAKLSAQSFKSKQTGIMIDKDNSSQIRRKIKKFFVDPNGGDDITDVKLNKNFYYRDNVKDSRLPVSDQLNKTDRLKVPPPSLKESIPASEKAKTQQMIQNAMMDEENYILEDMGQILANLSANSNIINTQISQQKDILGAIDKNMTTQLSTIPRLFEKMDNLLNKSNSCKYIVLVIELFLMLTLGILLIS